MQARAAEVTYQVGDTDVAVTIKVKVPSWADPKEVVKKIEKAADEAFRAATSKPGL